MFVLHHNDNGAVTPFEYLPASAITPKMGMALVFSSGKLALATGTTAPEYICQMEAASAVANGTIIPVTAVQAGAVYETTLSASCNAALGAKVTIASDGLRVTGTTDSGVAELVYKEGTTTGSKVRVKF